MNDDTLTLYYYDDGLSEAERAEVGKALERDELLRQRYEKLCRELDGLRDAGTAPVPPDMAARFHDTIERAARLERGRETRRRHGFHLPSFAWGSAIAATLAIGVGIGFYLGNGGGDVAPDNVIADVQPGLRSDGAFARGLQVHLRESRAELADLPADSDADRAMLILHIVQQNRLFANAARDNSSDDLARLLRAFEPVLLRLAADDVTPEEAARLKSQLAFELDATLTKLERSASKETNSI